MSSSDLETKSIFLVVEGSESPFRIAFGRTRRCSKMLCSEVPVMRTSIARGQEVSPTRDLEWSARRGSVLNGVLVIQRIGSKDGMNS